MTWLLIITGSSVVIGMLAILLCEEFVPQNSKEQLSCQLLVMALSLYNQLINMIFL